MNTKIIIYVVIGVIALIVIALVLIFTLGKGVSAPSECEKVGSLCDDGRVCASNHMCQNCINNDSCPIGYICDKSSGKCSPHTDTRDELIKNYKLYCVDVKSDDGSKTMNLCFTDSTMNVPIYPTIGKNCNKDGSSSTFSIDQTRDQIIGNPQANMNSKNSAWIPFDDSKRLYYQQDTHDPPVMCILSDDHHYDCQNDGVFQQDKKNVSKTGKCVCKDNIAGDKCQYTRDNTCHKHGNPTDSGTCVNCDKGYSGPDCNCSDANCNHGKIDNPSSGSCDCKCDTGWVDAQGCGKCCKSINGACYTVNDAGSGSCSSYKIRCGVPRWRPSPDQPWTNRPKEGWYTGCIDNRSKEL